MPGASGTPDRILRRSGRGLPYSKISASRRSWGVKLPFLRTDTGGVRLALSHKFVLGSLAVAGAAMALPELIRTRGVDFSTWGSFPPKWH